MDDAAGAPGKRGNGEAAAFRVVDRRPRFDADSGAPDSGAPDAAATRRPAYVEELEARRAEAELRATEAERRARDISAAYRRADEERDAFRERLARDLERRVDIARAGLMRKIVDVLDDFDRALEAARAAREVTALLDGVALTRDRLLQVLASEGVEPIETVGRPFDPALAEAIASEEVEDPAGDGLVIAEETRGYTLGGALLRPARVRVARSRAAAPSAAPDGPPEPAAR
jgi:molecular chaperone GrpE